MLRTKQIQLIDRNPDIFKDWGCKINCVKSPCHCKNIDPVTRYVCYKLFS